MFFRKLIDKLFGKQTPPPPVQTPVVEEVKPKPKKLSKDRPSKTETEGRGRKKKANS